MVRALVMAVSLVLALGCGSKGRGGGKPKVAVSIFPLYDVTRRIAGDRLDVQLVLPPGRSEHGYDPAPKEIARLDSAALGLVVGLDLDGWAETVLRTTGVAKLVRLGERVETLPLDGEGGAPDPHFWLDPQRMVGVVDHIQAELSALEPSGADVFEANARMLQTQLRALDEEIAARSKTWSKHTIVTFHGSMRYFAQRYGVRIAAVVEPIAGKEPTAPYIAEVLAAIRRSGAAAVFTEPQLDRAPGEMIATEAGIPLGELDPIGGVRGRDNYEALLRWNTDQLEAVLR